jgi:probable O-glycosylation ligase (exosortase A-associated)
MMRDAFFLLIFPMILYFCIKKPFIGVSVWLWVALFYPKGWVYGFASDFRYNLIIALATILAYLVMKNKPKTNWDSLSWLIFLFVFWTFISSIFTISYPELVWADWIEFFKIGLLYFFAIAILRTETHINTVIWVIALSIGFYASVEGLKYISSGGGHVLAGMAGHALGDRNDLATAINMSIPLVVYLLLVTQHKLLRLGLIGMILLCVVSVLGSNSRGGFIGISVLGAYFWFHSKHKFLYLIIVPPLFWLGLDYMPEAWHQRMATIENVEQDLSFLGRIMAWKESTLIALDNITGGGFKAGQTNYVWHLYYPQFSFNWLVDTSGVVINEAKAAHSIYFQVLGDHGFPGLFLFVMMLYTGFNKARQLNKKLNKYAPDSKLAKLSSMIQLSIVTYMVSGAAVSLAYFDLIYMIFALIFALEIYSRTLLQAHQTSEITNTTAKDRNYGAS